jgi:hypothetical protein
MVSGYLTIWHYLAIFIAITLAALALFYAIRQKNKQSTAILSFTFLLFILLATMGAFALIDEKTKKVKLFEEEHFRILSIEKIIFTGAVENRGNYPIAKVTYKVKMINHKSKFTKQEIGTYFESKTFLDYFRPNHTLDFKSQSVEEEFVVAKNLQPGEIKYFRIDMSFPPYFETTSYETSAYAH